MEAAIRTKIPNIDPVISEYSVVGPTRAPFAIGIEDFSVD